jgi:hypothetical protein
MESAVAEGREIEIEVPGAYYAVAASGISALPSVLCMSKVGRRARSIQYRVERVYRQAIDAESMPASFVGKRKDWAGAKA